LGASGCSEDDPLVGSTACRRLDVDVDVDDGVNGREKEREDGARNAVQWILDDGRAMAADATRSKGRRSAMVSADYLQLQLQYCCLSFELEAHPLNTIFFRFRTRFWDKMSWPSSKILCERGGVERMLFGEFWVFRNIIAGGVEITSSRVSQYNTSTAR